MARSGRACGGSIALGILGRDFPGEKSWEKSLGEWRPFLSMNGRGDRGVREGVCGRVL